MPSDHLTLTLWPADTEHATADAMILHFAALVVANNAALNSMRPLSGIQWERTLAALTSSMTAVLLLTALRDGCPADEAARDLYDRAHDDGQGVVEDCWELLAAAGHDPQAIAAAGENGRAAASAKERERRG